MWHDSMVFTYSNSFNSANNPKHCCYELHFTHGETLASWRARYAGGVALLWLRMAAVEEAVLWLDGLEVDLEDICN